MIGSQAKAHGYGIVGMGRSESLETIDLIREGPIAQPLRVAVGNPLADRAEHLLCLAKGFRPSGKGRSLDGARSSPIGLADLVLNCIDPAFQGLNGALG